jgi:hypothetical protein
LLLTLFLALAGLASLCLETFLAPLAPPFDFALSFRRHRNLFVRLILSFVIPRNIRKRAAGFAEAPGVFV